MLRKMIEEDGKKWDQLLPYLLFAIREVPQSFTGFDLFELCMGVWRNVSSYPLDGNMW